MDQQERKRRRNQTDSPDKQANEKCITCKEPADSDVIECQWCQRWEHKVCAKLSDDDFTLLGRTSDRIRFYCSQCAPRVDVVLKFFDDFHERQVSMDARLQNIESQLVKLGGYHQVHASALSEQPNSEGMQID